MGTPDLWAVNPHLALGLAESFVSPTERAWLNWVKQVEKLLGHSLDGDNSESAKRAGSADGYSLDEAHDAFADGVSSSQYAREVRVETAARECVADAAGLVIIRYVTMGDEVYDSENGPTLGHDNVETGFMILPADFDGDCFDPETIRSARVIARLDTVGM